MSRMSTASKIALALEDLAARLKALPEDQQIETPQIWFPNYYGTSEERKQRFYAVARSLPHPVRKRVQYGTLNVENINDTLEMRVSVEQAVSCTIIEQARPARYKCEPILSSDEEAEFDVAE